MAEIVEKAALLQGEGLVTRLDSMKNRSTRLIRP